jgi:predicted transcriptional regulator
MDSHMEQAHPQGPENQNIIEAIGMAPERFAEISEDVKSHIFTSPAYLQRNHDLSEEEATAVLLELQHQGYVTTDHIDGAYGVFPEGVESRELTPERRRQTSKLGRTVLGPIRQATREYVSLTKYRTDKVKRVVTAAPAKEEKTRIKKLSDSKDEQASEQHESYKQSVEEARLKHAASPESESANSIETEEEKVRKNAQLRNFVEDASPKELKGVQLMLKKKRINMAELAESVGIRKFKDIQPLLEKLANAGVLARPEEDRGWSITTSFEEFELALQAVTNPSMKPGEVSKPTELIEVVKSQNETAEVEQPSISTTVISSTRRRVVRPAGPPTTTSDDPKTEGKGDFSDQLAALMRGTTEDVEHQTPQESEQRMSSPQQIFEQLEQRANKKAQEDKSRNTAEDKLSHARDLIWQEYLAQVPEDNRERITQGLHSLLAKHEEAERRAKETPRQRREREQREKRESDERISRTQDWSGGA